MPVGRGDGSCLGARGRDGVRGRGVTEEMEGGYHSATQRLEPRAWSWNDKEMFEDVSRRQTLIEAH